MMSKFKGSTAREILRMLSLPREVICSRVPAAIRVQLPRNQGTGPSSMTNWCKTFCRAPGTETKNSARAEEQPSRQVSALTEIAASSKARFSRNRSSRIPQSLPTRMMPVIIPTRLRGTPLTEAQAKILIQPMKEG